MKNLLLTIYALFFLYSFTSCVYVESLDGVSPRGTATRTFDFKNFNSLRASNAFRVHVVAGNSFGVSATGEQNDLDDLEIFVQDGQLTVRYDNTWRMSRSRMDIDITMPDLTHVDFSSAVTADISGFGNLNKMNFSLSGASRCDFEGAANQFTFDLNGASQLEMEGNARYLDGELSGASRLDAFDMVVEESRLDLSGASQAQVRVSKLLDVKANGASSVRYKGSPVIQKELRGGSIIRQD